MKVNMQVLAKHEYVDDESFAAWLYEMDYRPIGNVVIGPGDGALIVKNLDTKTLELIVMPINTPITIDMERSPRG